MKDNDMQGQHQIVQNLDKRRLNLEKSVIKHTTRWATIKQEEEMPQKRIEGEEDIKEIDNRVLEMRRELNGLKRLNQSYQALYEDKCDSREVILWHSRMSDVLRLGVVSTVHRRDK